MKGERCCKNCRWRRADNPKEGAYVCANEYSPWHCEWVGKHDYCSKFEEVKAWKK